MAPISKSWTLHTFQFRALGGNNELKFMAPKLRDVSEIAKRARDRVVDIEQKYSRYRRDSIVSRINAAAGEAPVAIDSETEQLLEYADKFFRQSDGLFDITSGVLRRVWDFKSARIPSEEALASVLPLIGWQKVERTKGFVRLPIHAMEIDFGGFGKEYAVDCVADLLLAEGIDSGIINFAGDLRVLGPKADDSPWSVGIVHPRNVGTTIQSVAMSKGAMASSGDYERYFELEGRRYCHILNPRTGWPVSDLQSVSVLSTRCLEAGSLSTIAMLMGEERGLPFLQDLGISFIAVVHDGTCITHPR